MTSECGPSPRLAVLGPLHRGVGLAGSFSWAPSPPTSNSRKMSRFASWVPFAIYSLESPHVICVPKSAWALLGPPFTTPAAGSEGG